MAEREWTAALGAVTEEIADCFKRREPRAVVREMTEAMLMELDTRNCWTLAEALGHRGPHRLQHLLSRAAVDHDGARDRIAAWAAGELADPDAVLIVDETGDEKSSTDCVGAARQYSGALGGIGLCQVASTSPTPAGTGTPRSTGPCTSTPSGPPTRNDACSPVSPTMSCSPPSRSWPASCSPAPATWASRPAGWPATRSTEARSCAGRPAHSASTTPWPSAPTTAWTPPSAA